MGQMPHVFSALPAHNSLLRQAAIEGHQNMDTQCTLRRIMAGALVTGSISAAGMGLASGIAEAGTGFPHHWCPGDHDSTAPTSLYQWDWNICHTYYWTKGGQGNVPFEGSLQRSNLWDGDNPPPDSSPGCGTDMFTGIPGRC
jgi:hypothetical protein